MDIVDVLFAKATGGGGSLPISVEPLSVTKNGTYVAEEGKAFSPVNVNVPGGNALVSSEPSEFKLETNLVSVDIPEGITKIENRTFYRCANLKNVNFPNSLRDIGDGAFNETGLTNIEFPIKLSTIGDQAFELVNISEIEFFYYVTKCSNSAFTNCPVEKIIIHSNRLLLLNFILYTSSVSLLKDIYIDSYVPPQFTDELYFDNVDCKFYVPLESVNIYKTTYSNIAEQIYGRQIQDHSTVIADWDFSSPSPLVDLINGYVLDDNNVSFQNGNAIFRNSDSYLKLPISPVLDETIDFYEYEIEVNQIGAGTRLFVQSSNFGSSVDTAYGLFFYQNIWQFWVPSQNIRVSNNLSDLNNSTIRVRIEKIDDANASVTVFKDSYVIAGNTYLTVNQSAQPTITDFSTFSLGSHRSACNMDIKRLKVKTGKYI